MHKRDLGSIELEESTSINFSFHSSSSSREIPDVKVSIGRLTSEDILCDFVNHEKAFSSLLSLDIFVPHTSELRPVALSVGPYEDTYPPRLISVAHQDWLGKTANPYFMSLG
ncbi:hypothetical protein PSHT_12298 [Puccinia striiformis]|uniref:Uncharacterized protein n=1 Tax=Puccinia striiformis TaxID=27350 RepID=A0A2S4UXZ7_9BASI|nr:hypothetical protein PSHT_12298 [Puccinia striiformis]